MRQGILLGRKVLSLISLAIMDGDPMITLPFGAHGSSNSRLMQGPYIVAAMHVCDLRAVGCAVTAARRDACRAGNYLP